MESVKLISKDLNPVVIASFVDTILNPIDPGSFIGTKNNLQNIMLIDPKCNSTFLDRRNFFF
jgi:hypothetical protein